MKLGKKQIIAEPEIKRHELQPGDEWIVLASDGLWDVLSNADAAEICKKYGDAMEASKGLVEAALKKGSNDNITVGVVDVRAAFSSGPPPSVPVAQIAEETDEPFAFDTKKLDDTEPTYSGWLFKKSSKTSMLGSQWQKRWYSIWKITEETDEDSSLHANWQICHFIIAYHTDQKETKLPRKPRSLDPTYKARREETQDIKGKYFISVQDATSGKVNLLATQTEQEADEWILRLNDAFKTADKEVEYPAEWTYEGMEPEGQQPE
mmetsp:Transcript_31880/g.49856  ORF Transcript_31880/g.49856 Transcript_31880/m.49856 type:complete len:264 (-) Transcript_31880:27-818(-)